MKFQRIKDILCGALIASMVLSTGTVAFAKVANINIPVSYNNIKVIVDGKQLTTNKEPFTYEGTTYLPIRAVAEAVGKDVSWDGKTQTVTLSSKDTKTEQKAEQKTEEKKEDTSLFNATKTKKSSVSGSSVKIKCTNIKENYSYSGGFEMDFSFENKSSMHYHVTIDKFEVNGKKINAFIYADCLDFRTTHETLNVWSKDLKEAGISKIEKINIVFKVSNDDDWEDQTLTDEMVFKF